MGHGSSVIPKAKATVVNDEIEVAAKIYGIDPSLPTEEKRRLIQIEKQKVLNNSLSNIKKEEESIKKAAILDDFLRAHENINKELEGLSDKLGANIVSWKSMRSPFKSLNERNVEYILKNMHTLSTSPEMEIRNEIDEKILPKLRQLTSTRLTNFFTTIKEHQHLNVPFYGLSNYQTVLYGLLFFRDYVYRLLNIPIPRVLDRGGRSNLAIQGGFRKTKSKRKRVRTQKRRLIL